MPATQLIKEIAALETEVVYLEQYLLSLYRKAFISLAVSPTNSNSINEDNVHTPPSLPKVPIDATPMINSAAGSRALTVVIEDSEVIMAKKNRRVDASVQRCHSSLSQCSSASAFAARISPPTDDSLGKSVRACQSQPLSMMEVPTFSNF